MCGIVGYIGDKNIHNLLISGLKRLEYRGYDSAGLALCKENQKNLNVFRSKGKIVELEKLLSKVDDKFSCGIGHTRWATHGVPSVQNAHPHVSNDGKIAVVHNGIIENNEHLREVLIEEGFKFSSETDTEVLVHLISKYYKDGDLFEAVSSALKNVEGTYGIAVIAADKPGVLVGAKNGSPLIVGIGENEMLLASDASALGAYTSEAVYLSDGEIVVLNADSYHTYNLEHVEINKDVEKIQIEMSRIEKSGYDHYMLKEIYEQDKTINDCFRGRLLPEQGIVKLGGLAQIEDKLKDYKKITITACGTSWHAALVGEYLFEELAGIPTEVEYASEFRYRNPVLTKDNLVIVISQSGETADTLAALREAKMRGCTVFGITNVIGSTIARETDCGIYIHAGIEIGVASTKAFTSQVTALFLLAIKFGRTGKISGTKGIEYLKALMKLPELVKKIYKKSEDIKKIALEFSSKRNFLYLGRGIQFPVALEGALKLKEISYIHAEGYPAAEMKHGPIALIDEDMPVVVLALQYGVYDKLISNIHEVKARKGRVIAIASENDKTIDKIADYVIRVPVTLEALSPILSVIPLQLLSYYIAVERGCDVDQPRNLAKSVTVE